MKKYYINYYKDFSNTFTLASVDGTADALALTNLGGCWERITLKNALAKIREEKELRKYSPSSGGYGDITILSASELYKICNYDLA